MVPGVLGIAAAATLTGRRRLGSTDDLPPPADAVRLEPDPIVIFVGGHGDGLAEHEFAQLVEMMGLDPEDVRYFDYRYASNASTPETASQNVSIDDAEHALRGLIEGVAQSSDRPIYLVGFSKGAATIAELIADWDDGAFREANVIGAALLDPPMATGVHGWLQSIGRFIGPIPDDGGYDPVECKFLGLWCTDDRDHLGWDAGVDVMVVRNPNAAITNFGDLPEGLRVYEAPDEGRSFLDMVGADPLRAIGRASEAHRSVLHDPKVAACIAAELQALGSCNTLEMVSEPPSIGDIVERAARNWTDSDTLWAAR